MVAVTAPSLSLPGGIRQTLQRVGRVNGTSARQHHDQAIVMAQARPAAGSRFPAGAPGDTETLKVNCTMGAITASNVTILLPFQHFMARHLRLSAPGCGSHQCCQGRVRPAAQQDGGCTCGCALPAASGGRCPEVPVILILRRMKTADCRPL